MAKSNEEPGTYVDQLRSIEKCLKSLTTGAQKSDDDMSADFKPTDIEKTCSCISKYLEEKDQHISDESNAMLLVAISSTLIRIYVADRSNIITSQKNFEKMVEILKKQMKNPSSPKPSVFANYAGGMLELLLSNFDKDNFLIKYLEPLFPNEPTSESGDESPKFGMTHVDEKKETSALQRPISKPAPKNSDPTSDHAARDLTSAMIQFAADLAFEADIRQPKKFRNDYQPLVRSLLNLVDSFFARYNGAASLPSTVQIIQAILSLMCNLSGKIPLVPMFLKDDQHPPLAAGWLDKLSFKIPISDLCKLTLKILYNLTRHKNGLQALRKAKTFALLMKRKSDIIEKEDEKLKESLGVLLIALAESDEDQKENNTLILEVSDGLFKNIIKAEKEDDWRCDECHLSEYLYSLRRAMSNTLVVRHLLGDSRHVELHHIKFFGQLLCKTYGLLFNPAASDLDRFVIKFLLDIILGISNYDDYRPMLQADHKLVILVETLARQPHQDVAKRIFANLQLGKNLTPAADRTPKKNSSKIYISYNWTDEEFCKKLFEALQACTNVPIWVALEHGDDLQDSWNYSGPAIDSATIIIVLVSNAYGRSSRNRQELNYALAKNHLPEEAKSLIVVDTVPDFKYNQEWMHSLLREGEKISFRKRIDEMAQMTADQVTVLTRKRLFSMYSPVKTAQSRICSVM